MANAWQVLSKCFEMLEDGKLVNEKLHSLRTEKDIERLKKSENGKKGGIAKASAKQVPSNSHIEEKRREKKKREEIATPEGVSESTFKDFLILRKAKRLPWTATVQKQFLKEAQKIGWSMQQVIEHCCKKSWAGFEASWVQQETLKTIDKPAQRWDSTLEGVMAKGRELGILPKPGETEGQYRERVRQG